MKSNIKEVEFGAGIGDLRFGMSQDDVKNILGNPDEIENIETPEGEVSEELVSWHYNDLELSLIFDQQYDWKLVSLSCSDPHYTLHGRSIVGIDQDEFEDFLENLGIEISNVEDISDEDDTDFVLLESEETGLLVWFENGESVEFQILPDVEEDGETIIWP
jgi:hypothetical protein